MTDQFARCRAILCLFRYCILGYKFNSIFNYIGCNVNLSYLSLLDINGVLEVIVPLLRLKFVSLIHFNFLEFYKLKFSMRALGKYSLTSVIVSQRTRR